MVISLAARKGETTGKRVLVHQKLQSEPVVCENVFNTYEKGSFYCVMMDPAGELTYKFPIADIWRVTEEGNRDYRN